MPTTVGALLRTDGFHGRAAKRYADQWFAALDEARTMPEDELPTMGQRTNGPPQVRVWADRDPVAAARLAVARPAVADLAEQLNMPVENLLTPDFLRRVIWSPPATEGPRVEAKVAQALRDLGAREWQISLTAPLLADAIEHPQELETESSED